MQQLPRSATTLRLGRLLFAAATILTLALGTLALLRAGVFYSFYTSLLAKVIDLTGLDLWASRAVALALAALLWFLPWHLLLLPWIGFAKRQVLTLGALAALAVGAMAYLTRDVYFSRSDGRSLKYYVRTLDGYKLAASPGTDPALGLAYQPITAAVAKDYLRWQARGGNIQDPTLPEGRYFSSTTGEPLRWYAKLPNGKIDMFTLPGFHPAYGTALRPVSAEIVAKYQKQQTELDRQRQAQSQAAERATAEAIAKARERQTAAEESRKAREDGDRQARERQTAAEARRKTREERDRQARERERMTRPLAPGRYLFASPAPAGDVDGFHYTLTEVDLTPERLQVQMEVANDGRTYVETLHQRSIRLGLLTADGTALAYTAIRAKEGALPPEGASFAFPSFGKRGAFVMEFTRPQELNRTFSIVVNDQPLFSGLNLHHADFRSF